MGGKLNGTKINNGRLDVFANWDLWHPGQKASCGQSLRGAALLFGGGEAQ